MGEQVSVGVISVIRRGDKILLGKRLKKDGYGFYIFPGGSLEHGESLEDCLKREVKEETGLTVTPGDVVYAKRTPPTAARQGIYVAFWCYPDDDSAPAGCDELGDPAFFTWEEATGLNVALSTVDILEKIRPVLTCT